jgi:hypothetical protein
MYSYSLQPSTTSKRRLQEWRYRLFGPTLVHLQYEFYLLCSLMLLTIGSLSGLYKESFGMYGDFVFLLLLFLVESRHLLFRILCTWDPSTHASPGITGLLTHLLQSHVTGGQSFDRPPAMQQLHTSSGDRAGSHVVGGSSSTAIASPAAADRMVQITGGVLEAKEIVTWSQLVPSSLIYAWQLPRQYIWFPLSRAGSRSSSRKQRPLVRDISNNSGNKQQYYTRDSDAPRNSWLRLKFKAIQQYTLHLWVSYGPSLQFCLASGAFVYYAWQFCYYSTGKNPLSLIWGADRSRHTSILSVHTQDSNAIRQAAEKEAAKMIGDYDRQLKPSESEVVLIMLGFGTLCSLLVFCRVMLPLPDLVAGGNVLKDVRAEARAVSMAHNAAGAVGGSGGGSKRGGRSGSGWLSGVKDWFSFSLMPSSVLASDSAVWTERQNSIAAENRLHLALNVLFVRTLENLFLVGLLPRSNFICRATGHCPPGPPLWELSRILYPGGFSSPKRPDGFQIFGFMESDLPSALWTLVSVVSVSVVLLLAQTFVLNRSYLSILAYHSLEWDFVENPRRSKSKKTQQPQVNPVSPASNQQQSATVWESKRKYMKGDLVYYPDASGAMYRATSNSPEGHPYDREFRGVNEMFRMELGHPATSDLLGKLAAYQLVTALVFFALWILLFLCGFSTRRYGLIWAVTAHVVTAHGVLSVTTTAAHAVVAHKNRSQPSNAMRTLQQLNAEIMQGN